MKGGGGGGGVQGFGCKGYREEEFRVDSIMLGGVEGRAMGLQAALRAYSV